jgi:uncharacterized membrane protein YdjX (TVP38/TMEM64 family)
VILAVAALTLALGSHRMEVWARIAGLLQDLQTLSAGSPVTAAGLYVLVFSVLVACCVPLAPAMSMAGGLLFGAVQGTACAVLSITLGCLACFLVVRTVFAGRQRGESSAVQQGIEQRLKQDGLLALLALRILPVVPSWLLNFASALAGMRLLPFVVATSAGVLPAVAVFATTGAGLGGAISQYAPPGLDTLLRPSVLLPLLALSALAAAPLAVRAIRRRGRIS